SRRRHTRSKRDWSSDVCSSDLGFPIQTIETDAFDFLREAYSTPERYDVIVLDPPAFCKSKKQLRQAWKGYLEINLRAMKLLKPRSEERRVGKECGSKMDDDLER